MEGFNIKFTASGKTLMGRTKDDLSVSAKTKSSITKDDAGVTNEKVVGHEVTFTVAGIIQDITTDTKKLNNDEILALALKTGDDAVVPVQYLHPQGKTFGGNAIITGYSESSDASAENDPTYQLNFKSTGVFAEITV